MKPFMALALGVVLAFASSAKAEDKKAEFDPAKLIGKWQLTGGKKNGVDASEDGIKTTTLVVEKDKMTLKTGIGDFVMKYTLDAKVAPMALDLEITDAPDKEAKGTKSKGILQLDGDTLKLSYNVKGGDRPKNFDAKKDSNEYSFIAKRIMADK